jgi:hypothetical protein
MKVNIEPTKEKYFDPIKVEFIIQSKRELEVFLAVFNACGSDLRDFANAHIPDGGANIKYFGHEESVNILSHDAWRELKRIYEGRLNNF